MFRSYGRLAYVPIHFYSFYDINDVNQRKRVGKRKKMLHLSFVHLGYRKKKIMSDFNVFPLLVEFWFDVIIDFFCLISKTPFTVDLVWCFHSRSVISSLKKRSSLYICILYSNDL